MYSDPKAIEMYAAKMKVPVELAKKGLPESHPRAAMQADGLSDVDGIMRDAVTNKSLVKPMTPEQLAAFYRFPKLGK